MAEPPENGNRIRMVVPILNWSRLQARTLSLFIFSMIWNNSNHRSSITSLVYVGWEGVRLPSQYGEMGQVVIVFFRSHTRKVSLEVTFFCMSIRKFCQIQFFKKILNYGTPYMSIYGAHVNYKWTGSESEVECEGNTLAPCDFSEECQKNNIVLCNKKSLSLTKSI